MTRGCFITAFKYKNELEASVHDSDRFSVRVLDSKGCYELHVLKNQGITHPSLFFPFLFFRLIINNRLVMLYLYPTFPHAQHPELSRKRRGPENEVFDRINKI